MGRRKLQITNTLLIIFSQLKNQAYYMCRFITLHVREWLYFYYETVLLCTITQNSFRKLCATVYSKIYKYLRRIKYTAVNFIRFEFCIIVLSN